VMMPSRASMLKKPSLFPETKDKTN